MIRVAFPYPRSGGAWLGGINYLRNLTTALAASAQEAGIEPVLLLPSGASPAPGFPAIAHITGTILDVHGWLAARGVWHRLDADPVLDRLLRARGVAVLSHADPLGRGATTPVIGWIPDFQHRHLPEFFSAWERSLRDAAFERTCRRAARVVVSSESAREDLARFHPRWAEKARVLRFVDCSAPATGVVPAEELERTYGFEGPFLLLPNQFWIHKNHRLVIEALGLLRAGGRRPLVLATGHTEDYRFPGFFAELMARRAELGVDASLKVLGTVPYAHLAALMHHAVAILNPSLFEGWSTTVEEAKSLGKRVLLSDIPVHREQSPRRATYFDPHDAGPLAEAIWNAWSSFDPAAEARAREDAATELPARRRGFAGTYAAVVRELAPRR